MDIHKTVAGSPIWRGKVRRGQPQGKQKVLYNPQSALGLYRNPMYLYIIIYAGKERRPFRLHRAVIAQNSGYFDNIFSSSDTDTSAIYLSDIYSRTFLKISDWLYNLPYWMTRNFYSRSCTIGIYRSTTFLGISGLKTDILKSVRDILREKLTIKHEMRVERDHFASLKGLCAHFKAPGAAGERKLLKECLEMALKDLKVKSTDTLSCYQDEEDSETLCEILNEFC
ncbi:hypothetical protein TWF106_005159 [Orbilia oligospora]|uniref:BTB domain-containing protein n=1 Tax=Orbilia oligospora TaxID=2813651 RepID=A0A6G1MKU8_ORBOL|nr:hypothetical protein TWF106_005159 [Orbilia oligospora]KAF3221826.1 hypothetical protein TWF679_007041 [Orbilia oligospora]KAF3230032.1 hypothetical protein TWF191_000271 [Orbilia oligospora]KAF3262420.1 hypothetical protein TWF192_007094 [Orbilia oligospora]